MCIIVWMWCFFSFSHHSYGAQWVLCLFAVLCVIRGPLLFRSDLLSSGYQWIFFVNWCGQMCCYFLFQTIDFKSFEWRVCSQCFSQCSCSFASNKVVCVMVMWLGGWDDLSLFSFFSFLHDMQSVVSVGFAKIALQSDPIPSSLKALRVFSERQTQKISLFVDVSLFVCCCSKLFFCSKVPFQAGACSTVITSGMTVVSSTAIRFAVYGSWFDIANWCGGGVNVSSLFSCLGCPALWELCFSSMRYLALDTLWPRCRFLCWWLKKLNWVNRRGTNKSDLPNWESWASCSPSACDSIAGLHPRWCCCLIRCFASKTKLPHRKRCLKLLTLKAKREESAVVPQCFAQRARTTISEHCICSCDRRPSDWRFFFAYVSSCCDVTCCKDRAKPKVRVSGASSSMPRVSPCQWFYLFVSFLVEHRILMELIVFIGGICGARRCGAVVGSPPRLMTAFSWHLLSFSLRRKKRAWLQPRRSALLYNDSACFAFDGMPKPYSQQSPSSSIAFVFSVAACASSKTASICRSASPRHSASSFNAWLTWSAVLFFCDLLGHSVSMTICTTPSFEIVYQDFFLFFFLRVQSLLGRSFAHFLLIF